MPPLPSPARRPPQRIAAGRTVVDFTWDDDRWRHSVTVADRLVAESVEGGADAAADPRWPASPVLVEVSLAGPADHEAILAVGLAGRSHFAASVAGDVEPDTLLFELACRLHERPCWLGSTYRTGPRPEDIVRIQAPPLDDPPPATLRWAYTIGPRGIVVVETPRRPTAGCGGR